MVILYRRRVFIPISGVKTPGEFTELTDTHNESGARRFICRPIPLWMRINTSELCTKTLPFLRRRQRITVIPDQ